MAGGEHLGHPEGGYEGDVGDAGLGAEHATRRQPREVGRHDHSHGIEGVLLLRFGDGRCESVGRRPAIGHGVSLHCRLSLPEPQPHWSQAACDKGFRR